MPRCLKWLAEYRGVALLVSNEVGSGIVPASALARRFQDEQGRLNQEVAALCDAVTLVVAGIAVPIKRSLESITTWPISEFLATALEAARAGAEVIRRYYQRNLEVTLKADKSPVTQADVETEQVIRSIIGQRFPAMASTARRPARARSTRNTCGWSIRSTARRRSCASTRSSRRRSRSCIAAG